MSPYKRLISKNGGWHEIVGNTETNIFMISHDTNYPGFIGFDSKQDGFSWIAIIKKDGMPYFELGFKNRDEAIEFVLKEYWGE